MTQKIEITDEMASRAAASLQQQVGKNIGHFDMREVLEAALNEPEIEVTPEMERVGLEVFHNRGGLNTTTPVAIYRAMERVRLKEAESRQRIFHRK